ncbi:Putative permease [Modestobacter italicus]|uniref:Permease n=1 Tax=Modestobacter italicus (strain DSM 44449 / CECT 9708 / BC 501) TaxID=2732864 RepID=I4EYI4_MODI5|nr:Putative permease [Modestobacter marinus]
MSTGTSWALPRGLIVVLSLASLVLVSAGMRSLAGVVGPAFLALMIVITVQPVEAWLQRHRVPGWLAATATIALAYAILLGLVAALAVSVARLATLLPTYGPQFTDLLNEVVGRLDDLGVTPAQIRSALAYFDLNNLLALLQVLLSRLAAVLSDLLFLGALILFMAVDAAHFPRQLAAAARIRPDVVVALQSFAAGTRRYIVVSTVFGLIVAALNVAELYWLAIPLPLLWGLLSFITNYIPNIGFVLGLLPPAALGLLQGGPRLLVLVVLAYVITNFVIQSLIQPKFVGDAVGLSITLTFLSLVFWSAILGPLGALLAIPLTLLAKALLIDIDPATRWAIPLISGAASDAAPGQPAAPRSTAATDPE